MLLSRRLNRRSLMLRALPLAALLLATAASAAAASGTGTARRSVDWSSGFENRTWSPWQGLQHEQSRPLADSFRFVTSPVRTGSVAAEFTVPHGYGPYGGERTELCCGPAGEGAPGTEHWWAWSTYFPTDWSEPYKWGLFFQLHAGDDMPPAIAFDAGANAVWLDVRTGRVDPTAVTWSYGAFPKLLGTLSKGRWNDFVLHVRWSLTDGRVEVWHRLEGQTSFAKLADLNHVPTLQQYASGRVAGIYTKLGLYRASHCANPAPGCSSPLGVQPTDRLYDDAFVRGSSFDDVVAAAWGRTVSAAGTAVEKPKPGPKRPARTQTMRLGSSARGSGADPGGEGYLDLSGPYRLGRRSLVSALHGLIAGESRPLAVRAVVYADRGGRPGALVASSRELRVPARAPLAWRTLRLRAPRRLAAGRYWLGYWYGPGAGSGGGGFRFLASRGAEAYARAPYRAAGAAPATFPSHATATSRYALYAVARPVPSRKETRP